MKLINTNNLKKNLGSNNLELALVLLSSALLGIWAVKHTIALRNILLVCGTLLSFYYFYQAQNYKKRLEQFKIRKNLPLLFLGLSLVWIVIHYVFFSVDATQQFKELKSTWLRALLATIIGTATGYALIKKPNLIILLWLGIYLSFVYLIFQYIPKVIAQNKLLISDYDDYIFHLKINIVLVGSILFCGVNSFILKQIISNTFNKKKLIYFFLWVTTNLLIFWIFIFIANTRNGIGISIILSTFWIIYLFITFLNIERYNYKKKIFYICTLFLIVLISLLTLNIQKNLNKGWNSFFDDIKIAIQINKYENWRDPIKYGYPQKNNGEIVISNNYERVAWATAGLKKIFINPLGVGVLSYPYSVHETLSKSIKAEENNFKFSTHSGWIEIGLAFGLPMLALLIGNLVCLFIYVIFTDNRDKIIILSLILMTLVLYTVGEVGIQHGIEILYYLQGLLITLSIKSKNNEN